VYLLKGGQQLVFDTAAASQRLQVVGLTRSSAVQIVQLVEKWVANNGAEEAVKRIKAIKVNLLRHYAGLPPLLGLSSWIKYRKEGPKGPFGLLFRLTPKSFRTAWNAVMVYTSLVHHSDEVWCTEEQWDNLTAAIVSPALESSQMAHGLAVVHKSPLKVRITVDSITGDSLFDYQTRDSKRAPQTIGAKPTAPEPETLINSLDVLIERTVWTMENWDILSGTCKGLENYILPILEQNMEDELRSGPPLVEIPKMGVISLIQEAGFKLRFAANPYRVYQAALQPLGRALFRALRAIPQDCTFDHDQGVRMVQSWLAEGKPAVSMDLSNATDRAPLDFQLEFLSRCGVPTRWLQFLRATCRGEWRVNNFKRNPLKATTLRWTVGSPLGLYPTFACFALWHHCVVQAAFAECGWDLDQVLPYVILGDDLVIMDYEVASVVRGWFLHWGMKVADHKGLSSDTVAEFAGRVISSSDVVRGFKWKGQVSDESFVAFAAQFGPRSLLMMRARHKRVLAFIGDLPEPFGLGWNPFGIPLEERLTPIIERVWARDERYRSFSSRAQRANKALYSSSRMADAVRWMPAEYVVLEAATSDQEAEAVVRAMLPELSSLGSAVWPNLPQVALERGVPDEVKDWYESMLKRQSILEDRAGASQLVILERKIRAVLSRRW
jgi:hypothetical protein